MRDKPYFAVIYMFIITAFFSSVLIGFSRLTRDRVQANEQLAFERAVLEVFPEIEFTSNQEIHTVFTKQFIKDEKTGAWLYSSNQQLSGYAVVVEGKGFWAPIKGVVGIALDGTTITGLAFYEQSETPGLGARIIEPDFCGQFVGRKIQLGQAPIGIRPTGETLKDNQVHSITGATQTCVRLEKLINDGLGQWLKTTDAMEEKP